MIRFILKRRQLKSGWEKEVESFDTIGIDIPLLEKVLTGGGVGLDCYDITTVSQVVLAEVSDRIRLRAKQEKHRDRNQDAEDKICANYT